MLDRKVIEGFWAWQFKEEDRKTPADISRDDLIEAFANIRQMTTTRGLKLSSPKGSYNASGIITKSDDNDRYR